MLTSESVKQQAAALGFDLCGLAPAARHPRLARLASWLAEGHAGDMTYLSKSLDERLDPTRVLASARVVVSLGCVYNAGVSEGGSAPTPGRAVIARYAQGDDYHDVLRARLRRLVEWMAAEAGQGFEAFSCVDNGPVQERVFAEQAGLGWIGKNTCLISPRLGSWIVLAEVLINRALDVDEPLPDQCGTCTRCLDACPTGAFVAPYHLDATKCLSYLTIETRGDVAPELRGAIRDQIFGCDICQDVCPWNRRAAVSADPVWHSRPRLASPMLLELCRMSDDEWRTVMKGSALRRAGLRRLRRSLALAAAHLPPADRDAALAALAAHTSGQDPLVVAAIAWTRDSSPSS